MRTFLLFVPCFVMMVCCTRTDPKIVGALHTVEELVLTKPDSALVVLSGVEQDNLQGKDALAKYRLLKTVVNDRLGIPHESTDDILAAKDYFVSISAPDSLLAIVNLYVGRVYYGLEQPRDALDAYLTAESHLDNTKGNNYWKGRTYYHIGDLYNEDFDYPQSIHFAKLAVTIFQEDQDALSSAYAYNLLGRNHMSLGDNNQALDMLANSNNAFLTANYTDGILSNALVMSNIFLKDPKWAYRADSLMRQIHNDHNGGLVPIYHYPMMSRIEKSKGDISMAIDYINDYICHVPNLALEKQATYKYLLADYHNELQHHKSAYNYLNEYVALMDSLNQDRVLTVLQEVERKYDKQKVEQEYAVFRRYNAYRFIIATLLLVGIIAVLFYKAKKRRQKNLSLQADLEQLRYEMSELDDLRKNLASVLNRHDDKEAKLQDILLGKASGIQQIVEYLHLYENNPDKFKKKIEAVFSEAKRDTYFGELHDIVNMKCAGIVDYIKREFPSLTKDEIDFFCLVCLGFSNNQLGILFGLKRISSVYNKRHVIRKKMNLLSTYDTLEKYIDHTVAMLEAERL